MTTFYKVILKYNVYGVTPLIHCMQELLLFLVFQIVTMAINPKKISQIHNFPFDFGASKV